MKKRILLSNIVVILSISFSFAGGGWTPKKKTGFFKLNQSILRANQFYGPNGDIVDITTISLYTTSLYGEYGFTDRIAGIVYAPFFVRSTLNEQKVRQTGTTEPGDELNAIGDFDLGFKYALVHNKEIAVSASITFGIPLGETQGGESGILQTGDGEFNQLIKVDVSKSFYPKPLYVSLSSGYNNRTQGFSDEIHFGAEIGYTYKDKLIGILKAYSVSSLNNGDAAGAANGVFSNNTEYFSFGPEVNYLMNKKVGISGSAAFAFSGKRILAAPNLNLGVFINL